MPKLINASEAARVTKDTRERLTEESAEKFLSEQVHPAICDAIARGRFRCVIDSREITCEEGVVSKVIAKLISLGYQAKDDTGEDPDHGYSYCYIEIEWKKD